MRTFKPATWWAFFVVQFKAIGRGVRRAVRAAADHLRFGITGHARERGVDRDEAEIAVEHRDRFVHAAQHLGRDLPFAVHLAAAGDVARGAGDVRVFQVNPGAADPVADTPIKSFRAFAASFQGGATVAVADLGTYSGGATVNANVPDGKMEIVVGSGAGMRATVQNYDVSATPRVIDTLLPLPSSFRNGVSVSSARVNGDAIDDIIVSSGRSGSTVRETFDGRIAPAANVLLHRDAVFAEIGATAAPLFSAPIDLDGDHIADKFFHALGDQGKKAYPGVRATDPAGSGDQTISQLNFSQRIAASRVSRTQPIQTTASGLMIQDVSVGAGAVPAINQQVTVHFVATTPNGSVARNTRETLQPLSLRLDSAAVMPGLVESIRSMRVGGTRRVIIPPSLQTGSVPSGLPSGDELVFEIELISATN